nr:hypothetical protein [Parachlamydiaceae bacterium]
DDKRFLAKELIPELKKYKLDFKNGDLGTFLLAKVVVDKYKDIYKSNPSIELDIVAAEIKEKYQNILSSEESGSSDKESLKEQYQDLFNNTYSHLSRSEVSEEQAVSIDEPDTDTEEDWVDKLANNEIQKNPKLKEFTNELKNEITNRIEVAENLYDIAIKDGKSEEEAMGLYENLMNESYDHVISDYAQRRETLYARLNNDPYIATALKELEKRGVDLKSGKIDKEQFVNFLVNDHLPKNQRFNSFSLETMKDNLMARLNRADGYIKEHKINDAFEIYQALLGR